MPVQDQHQGPTRIPKFRYADSVLDTGVSQTQHCAAAAPVERSQRNQCGWEITHKTIGHTEGKKAGLDEQQQKILE